jgi:hypothetical protein
MSVLRKKLLLARFFFVSGLGYLFANVQRLLPRKGHIRVVYCHGTPQRHLPGFEEQLRFYRRRYDDVSLADLDRFFASRRSTKKRPGLIISFDDDLRSNFHAAPLLERYKFTGWFTVPAALSIRDRPRRPSLRAHT